MDRVLAQFEDINAVATNTLGAAAWTAREAGGGRRVLIKRLPNDAGKTRATQSLSLRHPRIVPTRRWLHDGDNFYVIRDWVPGRNLRQTLADQTLRAFDRLHARLVPLLDALDYAHSAGLPHGALTPENVLTDEQFPEIALLSDFAAAEHSDTAPTPRRDFYDLCELYKEFLPARSPDDEAGAAARARLLRNLNETQQTVGSAEELRYKLDAVARMADLLGFSARDLEGGRIRQGAKLVCAVSPPTALVTPGGGATVTLALDNEGDATLHIESVSSDVVWLNLPNRFVPVDLSPGAGGDLIWTLSGARLEPGTYNAMLTIRSNDGLLLPTPSPGASWPIQTVAVPVFVKSPSPEEAVPVSVPLAESLHSIPSSLTASPPANGEHPGIACVQEPDPGLVRYGQSGVLHLGVQNIGPTRLRVDKVRARQSWLVYPGEFRALWIEPGETQFLGFSLLGAGLAGGDYKAEVTFTTSVLTETLLGPKPVWRDMTCEVRVRVVRGGGDALPGGLAKTGCTPLLLTLTTSFGLLAFYLMRFL